MADARAFQSPKKFDTLTIAVGQTTTQAIDLGGASLVGIITDANITGTEISFTVSNDLNGTYVPYKTNTDTPAVKDVKVAVAATTAQWYGVNATDFAGIQYIKLVSGTTQAGSDSVINLVLRGTPA
jgi:hypothetical protein